MIGLIYFVLFVAIATVVKFTAQELVAWIGPYPFIPLLIGLIVYGFWYERRAASDSSDL